MNHGEKIFDDTPKRVSDIINGWKKWDLPHRK